MAEIVDTIGSGVGRDYATIQAWINATDAYDCVGNQTIRVGECYDDSVFLNEGVLLIDTNPNTDKDYYRHLRAAPGHRFDPSTGSGVIIRNNGNCLILNEPGARATGIAAENTLVGVSGNVYCFNTWSGVTADNPVVYDSCVAMGFPNHQSVNAHGFNVQFGKAIYRNCMAFGASSGTDGTRVGFHVTTVANNELYNCLAYGCATHGFELNSGTNTLQNCVAADCTLGAFDDNVGTSSFSFCADDDLSLVGKPNCITQIVEANVWVSPGVLGLSPDFHLKEGSVLIGAGTDKSGEFTVSIEEDVLHGTNPTSAWDIGPYAYPIVTIGLSGGSGGPGGGVGSARGVSYSAMSYFGRSKSDDYVPVRRPVHQGPVPLSKPDSGR